MSRQPERPQGSRKRRCQHDPDEQESQYFQPNFRTSCNSQDDDGAQPSHDHCTVACENSLRHDEPTPLKEPSPMSLVRSQETNEGSHMLLREPSPMSIVRSQETNEWSHMPLREPNPMSLVRSQQTNAGSHMLLREPSLSSFNRSQEAIGTFSHKQLHTPLVIRVSPMSDEGSSISSSSTSSSSTSSEADNGYPPPYPGETGWPPSGNRTRIPSPPSSSSSSISSDSEDIDSYPDGDKENAAPSGCPPPNIESHSAPSSDEAGFGCDRGQGGFGTSYPPGRDSRGGERFGSGNPQEGVGWRATTMTTYQ